MSTATAGSTAPSGATERSVTVSGEPCRVLEKGEGQPLGYLAGPRGVPCWLPFLDELAQSHRVIVPSLPGFPGGAPTAFRDLDDHLDWLAATLDLLEGAGLTGADLVASSMSGMLAADVAALSPATVRRLVLIGPWGIYDTDDPGPDYFAQLEGEQPALLVSDTAKLADALRPPDGEAPLDTKVVEMRATEAAARLAWPFGDRHVVRRLHRIVQPTLVLWGEADRVLPPSYARRWAEGLGGPCEVVTVPGAGHECVIDEPEVTAGHVARFLDAP